MAGGVMFFCFPQDFLFQVMLNKLDGVEPVPEKAELKAVRERNEGNTYKQWGAVNAKG